MKINTILTFASLSLLTPWLGPVAFAASEPANSPPAITIPAGERALPTNAQAGKCYARVFEDPKYRTETEQVLRKEASEKIEIIPAKYEMIEEKVLLQAAYDKEEIVPAQYETVTEQVLVKPATTRWKKGRGLVEKVDNFTGEIMCLEEVPAEYKSVTKQVLKAPPTTRLVHIPAKYKTVKVKKLITPAQEKRTPIPAEYQTVTKRVKESEGQMVWREVLCETNAPELFKTKTALGDIHAQSRSVQGASSSAQDPGKKDWFFLWDYDELFNNGRWVRAQ